MTLQVHVAPGLGPLAESLAGVLADPLPDPMQAEVVGVPTRGMAGWLRRRLARSLGARPGLDDGVAAAIRTPFPGTLVREVLDAARGGEPAETARWWEPDTLALAVAAVRGSDPRVAGPGRPGLAAARRIADLFDRYHLHRPAMVREWAEPTSAPADPDHRLVVESLAWQPRLWKAVRSHLGVPSPAEELPGLLEVLRAGPPGALPPRLSVFGVASLPPAHLEVLAAAATHLDVHLFLLHPSPALADPAPAGPAPGGATPGAARGDLPPRPGAPGAGLGSAEHHPLLRSWARSAGEPLEILGRLAPDHVRHPAPGAASPPGTLLARLQHDLRSDAAVPAPAGRWTLPAGDASVQVHECHGPARQVEVLHDALLHLLAADPTLQPRDVVVLTPDLATFAPLVEGVFAGPDAPLDPARPRLPAAVARPTGTPNDLLRALDSLLRLVTARCSAADVVDLAGYRPVQLALGLEPGDVDVLADWAERAGVRWGLDGAHRSRWGLPEQHGQHTWQAAVDRLLAGVAVDGGAEHLTVGGVAPASWVEGDGVRLAGLAAELVARLREAVELLEAPRPLHRWAEDLDHVAARLLAVTDDQAWQRRSLDAILADLRRRALVPGAESVLLTVNELRLVVASATSAAAPPADVDAGSVTVAELASLRAVPSRVVCLLGLDQEPLRRPGADADDLLARDPRLGDPDARTELRAQLLDTVLAASQHLVVTRSGSDLRTNRPVPPAIPVAELLEALDLTAEAAGGDPATSLVVHRHPRQATAVECLRPGWLLAGRPWSFDPAVLAGALARRELHPHAFLDEPLEPLPEPVVPLGALADCLRKPVRSFVWRRLGASLSQDPRNGDTDDLLPLHLEGLDRWSLAHELLDARRHELDHAAWERHQRATGVLPMGDLADAELARVGGIVGAVVDTAASKGIALGAGDRLDVEVPLPGGRTLAGEVDGVQEFLGRAVVAHLLVAKLAERHKLDAWVDLLALTAARPEVPWEALVVGRAQRGDGAESWHVRLAGPDRERTARATLAELVAFYDRAGRAPLVLPLATGVALATGDDAEHPWELYERADPFHQLVFGDVDLTTLRARSTVARDPEGVVRPLADEARALWELFTSSWEPV